MTDKERDELREYMMALDEEEFWEVAHMRNSKPCPACGWPVDDPSMICCESCIEEWENE